MSDEPKPAAPPPPVSPSVVGSTVQFSNVPGIDPEGQQVRRTFSAPIAAGPGQAGVVHAQGMIPGHFEYDVNALDLANSSKSSCAGCKHWNQRAFHEMVNKWTGPASTAVQRQTIQGYREKIKKDGLGFLGETVEQTLFSSFGICGILTEWVESAVGKHEGYWPITPMRDATCPTYVQAGTARMEVVTPAQPLGLFKPISVEAEKIGADRYDRVLFSAAHKIK